MKNITIIGSGFAGLTAVRQLRKQDKHCEITLISRTESKNTMLPQTILFHWTKRLFEWWYPRKYK